MCECWEFACGHTTESHCQDYKNRVLIPAENNGNTDDDDPFIDTSGRASVAHNRLSRVRSDSSPNRPPQFILPSPTMSPDSSDISAPSSAPNIRRRSSTSLEHGPGPSANHAGSLIAPASAELPLREISSCRGPSQNKRQSNDQCYDCILQNAKNNTTFQQDERAAETRLYNEIARQGDYSRGGVDRRSGVNSRGQDSVASSSNSSYMRNSPNYFNNAIPHRDPNSFTGRGGGHHHHPPSRPFSAQSYGFPPPAPTPFFDYANYQGPGPPPPPGPGIPPPQGDQYQQQNQYQFPLEPLGGGGQQQYGGMYTPQMGYQTADGGAGGGGPGSFDEFAYQQMQNQMPQGGGGYGYFGDQGW